MLKKLLLTFLTINLLFVTVFTPIANAQVFGEGSGTWYNPGFDSWVERVFDDDNPEEIFGERYTYAQVRWIFFSFTAILIPDFILTCMAVDAPDSPDEILNTAGDIGSCIAGTISALLPVVENSDQQDSFAGTLNYIIATAPASGIGYLKTSAQNLHLIPEARAQSTGFGFDTLGSVQSLWKVVRNMAYILMIIAFVVMAFMIMFRTKTSPQTVITVQSALPKLILTLLLVTFSFAIAGFVIDLAYLVLGLFAMLVSASGEITNMGSLDLFNALLGSHPIFAMFIIPFIILLASIVLGVITSWTFIGPIATLIIAIIPLLLVIFFVYIWIKITWLLFKSLINIILLVIVSPIIILLGIFPQGGGFGTWLRNLAANVAIFPSVVIMIFISHFLFWSSLGSDSWVGQLFESLTSSLNTYGIQPAEGAGSITLPGLALDPSTGLFTFVLSFAILALVPSVGNIIQSFISGRPFGYGSALGETVTAPIQWGGKLGGAVTEKGFQQQFSKLKALIGRGPSDKPPSPRR